VGDQKHPREKQAVNYQLLIATNNRGKVSELRELLSDVPVKLVIPDEIGLALTVEEDGRTYAENAAKKALAFARASGLVSLADDSGLEVWALGGAPGLYSARYSPKPGASDADRRAFLLENLRSVNAPQPWKAQFHATIAIATPKGEVRLAEGVCPGVISAEERGTGGFGYDPIFLLPERGLTMAELGMQEKNRLSHRARAVMAARPILTELFGI
jgi:XTP/dITP diphosphohydrolase